MRDDEHLWTRRLNKSETEQYNIVDALGQIYFAIYHVDVKKDSFVEIKSSEEAHKYFPINGKASETGEKFLSLGVQASSKPEMCDFMNLGALNDKLRDTNSISQVYASAIRGWCRANWIVVSRGENGDVSCALFAVSDVNEQVQRELEQKQKLQAALEAADRANRAKSTFLFHMSHDIRTPMNAIMGFTNIALKQNPDPAVRNCLEKIEESSEHLLMLINDVLDLSRIESGKAECIATPIDICEVMDTALATMQGFLTNRNLNFQVERQISDPLYVLGDALRIREILVNILNNAVKFTDDGGTIIFRASQKPGEDGRHTTVCLSVSDTGVGMSEEFKGRIFDEFAQEESGARTQYNGTGLGMPITKRYVEMMGGQIDVESEKWVGTTVRVELPMELVCVESPEKQEASFAQADLSGVHVLMAEDNELNAEIAKVQLEEFGMQVTRVADGKEAVEAFVNNPADTFDLILMDIMMPVMNGYDATRAIRSIGNRADASTIPIIAVTANAFAEDAQNAMDAGMDAHLAKPLVMDEVTKTIAGKVRKKRKNHEDH